MSYSSELTKQRILNCAKDEFLSHGFKEANLRRIASEARTTTGAIYHHFGGKNALFDALVADAANEFKGLFRALHSEQTTAFFSDEASVSLHGTEQVLSYIYDHFDVFRLLFLASEGSAYEQYLYEISQEEEQQFIQFSEAISKASLANIDKLFLCFVTRQGYSALYEIVSNNLSYEEAVQFIDRTFRFRMGGWLALRT